MNVKWVVTSHEFFELFYALTGPIIHPKSGTRSILRAVDLTWFDYKLMTCSWPALEHLENTQILRCVYQKSNRKKNKHLSQPNVPRLPDFWNFFHWWKNHHLFWKIPQVTSDSSGWTQEISASPSATMSAVRSSQGTPGMLLSVQGEFSHPKTK